MVGWVKHKKVFNITPALLPVIKIIGPESLGARHGRDPGYRVGGGHSLQAWPHRRHVSILALVVGIDNNQLTQ
ncbi:hypothetical protein D3C81_2129800 [compost metagenome]